VTGDSFRQSSEGGEKSAGNSFLGSRPEGRKGLGEMNPETLKETTMNPKTRSLMKVQVLDHKATGDTFDRLMGKDPKARFKFIQERAEYAELDI